MSRSHFVSMQTLSAPALVTGDLRVVPELQVLCVRLPRGGLVWSQPTAVIVESATRGEGRRLAISKGAISAMITATNGVDSVGATHAPGATELPVDKIWAAAQPGAVYSAPVSSGDYTIITASDVLAGGGYGLDNGKGSGGGGFSRGRPVATIIIGPDGVKIQPVVDATRVVLGVMAVIGGGLLAARLRARKLQK
jgi:hypothetical protein